MVNKDFQKFIRVVDDALGRELNSPWVLIRPPVIVTWARGAPCRTIHDI